MQNAKCKMQNAKCKMQNAKCKMQNAKCKMQNIGEPAKVGLFLRFRFEKEHSSWLAAHDSF
jgi:hypothetical protein